MVTWDVFNVIGTIAFAVSGAIVAMEEDYDIFGVFVLGFVTTFCGGLIRNITLGIPVSQFWKQSLLFETAFLSILVVFMIPVNWIHYWRKWVIVFDAIGLSAFAIQGALFAAKMKYGVGAVAVAAVVTGIGGGVVRDVLAGRKPLVLREEIYAMWALLVGAAIGLGWVNPHQPWQLYMLLCIAFVLRMLSVRFKWRFPRRSL